MTVSRAFTAVLSAAAFLWCAPNAAAEGPDDPAVCQSSVDSGVEVDTCTGNPNSPNDSRPDERVRVIPEFCFGLGFGGCGD
jgi:hypothetical protein